ncbi:unnamed protein product [Bathycoccus prasinos]
MSFRDGIIFKIASPHTEKIYIGCSSLPLNRAVSGLRASAKFRKLSCNILFQAGDIQSEVLEKFQDITVLEMRKKLGAIQTQYLEKCVNTNRAGRTNADRYRETKRQLEMYRENKDMFNRKHALKNMRIRGLPPRPSTILKYNITDEEIADCCFRSKIPRRGIYEYQRPENFAKHNALCKRDENYGILMGKPNNAICLDYDIYDPNCKEKQKYTLEYFKKVCGDDVYISRTPSGGYHAVFRYEARFDTWKNATKINGFIDIRTTGGYICGNGCETEKGSYRRLSGNILKLTNMPDTLYDMVEENANFAVRERTETIPMHQNVETQGISGDINTELQRLGFSGIYWTTSYGFKCDQNSGECPLCGKVSHFSNNFRVTKHEPTGDWYVANFSRECRSTKFIQGTKTKLPSFAFIL